MVYLNRLYTRTGDEGETSLGDGRRLAKTSGRVTAIGVIDEVNAAIGLAASGGQDDAIAATLTAIQNDVFELGAELALPDAPTRITAAHVSRLENRIDETTAQRPPLTQFILPGGTPTAATLHLARAISRRAEIETLRLAEDEPVNRQALIYLNRLSDLLFALARLANPPADEVKWTPAEGTGRGGDGEREGQDT